MQFSTYNPLVKLSITGNYRVYRPVYAFLEVSSNLRTWQEFSFNSFAGSTRWIWNVHANIHDFESTASRDIEQVSQAIFENHFYHLGLIFLWIRRNMFVGAHWSNYENWLIDPYHSFPALLPFRINSNLIRFTSRLFYVWRRWRVINQLQLFILATGAFIMVRFFGLRGYFHATKSSPRLSWFLQFEIMLNHHLTGLLRLRSLAWARHLIHVSIFTENLLSCRFDPIRFSMLYNITFDPLTLDMLQVFHRSLQNFFVLQWDLLTRGLSCWGRTNPFTYSLWISDIAHHHLAIRVIFMLAGHLYKTQYNLRSSLSTLLKAHETVGWNLTSWNSQLSLNLAVLRTLSIIVSQHIYAIPAYPFIVLDKATVICLYTHHIWIRRFFIVRRAAHASISVLNIKSFSNDLFNIIASHQYSITVHLNWLCIFLGFHSFGLLIHNDTLQSLGRPYDIFSDSAIQLQPIFAQLLQQIRQVANLRYNQRLLPLHLRTTDFLLHHIHAFTIHVTVLILLKGVLFAKHSRLVIDKEKLRFRFPCDGPRRGRTCQISAWDHIFLRLFWMYNSISIVIFHFSWKIQSSSWYDIKSLNFDRSASTINRWLRDFLWNQASQVIQSYRSALSWYRLIFLRAHFIWAFSLIFLFSGRRYWQELIESISWRHDKINLTTTIAPRALSIIQGRAVRVSHYLLRRICTTWAFFHAHVCAL